MIYRPHFAYETPEGCRDEPYEYYYDRTSLPVTTVPAGSLLPAMILGPFDKDAPFHWRGVRIRQTPDLTQNPRDLLYAIQWRANGELLSDAPINLALYAIGAGFVTGMIQGGMAVPLDEEIVLPPGSVVEATWQNESGTQDLGIPPVAPGITLLGVKRYWEGRQVA